LRMADTRNSIPRTTPGCLQRLTKVMLLLRYDQGVTDGGLLLCVRDCSA